MIQERIRCFSAWLAAVLILGTCGYGLIEGWNLIDGFYMSVITLATVGYGETQELSAPGRVFTCALIFVSIVSLSCWTACLTGLFVDRELSYTWQNKKVKKMAKSMKRHTIICGSGKMAQTIVKVMAAAKEPIIVVDSDVEALQQIQKRFPTVSTLNATAVDELALADANVMDAKCVVATLDNDFDNLLISMTCTDLGTDLKMIACSDDVEVANRMNKIGVDNVICPFHISGQQAAKLAMW